MKIFDKLRMQQKFKGIRYWAEIKALIHDCRIVAHPPGREKPIPRTASRLVFPWLSRADWLRLGIHYGIEDILFDANTTLENADNNVRLRLWIGCLPYAVDDAQFRSACAEVPHRASMWQKARSKWAAALAAGPSPVQVGANLSDVLSERHRGADLPTGWEIGVASIASEVPWQEDQFWAFLPYAVQRRRCVFERDQPNWGDLPDFADLHPSEVYALSLMHEALTDWRAVSETMSDLCTQTQGEVSTLGELLAGKLYGFQKSAEELILFPSLPDTLPYGRNRSEPTGPISAWDSASVLLEVGMRYWRKNLNV